MDTLNSLSQEEQLAFIRLIAYFDYNISSITDGNTRMDFLDKFHLSSLIASFQEHEDLLKTNNFTQILQEECYQEMDLIKSHIIANASLQFIPYIYQVYQPQKITAELRKALEFSLEALDWLSAAFQNQKNEFQTGLAQYNDIAYSTKAQEKIQLTTFDQQIDTALSVKQMVSNLSVGYDEYHNQGRGENTNFSRILYSPDENYTRLHETHILTRSFQMYASEGLTPLQLMMKGHHQLLLKSVLYKEILKPDLSGLSVPIPDYLLLMAQTIYLHAVRQYLNKTTSTPSLIYRISDNLKQVGIDTYDLDILAENYSDEYIQVHREVSTGIKSLADIPERFVDSTIIQEALQYSLDNFPAVPTDRQTPQMCEDAVSYKPHFLQFVSPSLVSPELCTLAVRLDGLALQFVPLGFRTQDLFHESILSNGEAIQFIPEALITLELALSAVSGSYSAYFLLPESCKGKETLLAAMRRYPAIYKELQTSEREIVDAALLAINSDPLLAAFLPETLATNIDFINLAHQIPNGWDYYIPDFKE